MAVDFSRPFLLISADRNYLSLAELEERREQLETLASINGYTVEKCEGEWQGETEVSFLIHGKPENTGHSLDDLGSMFMTAYDQDAYIIYDGVAGYLKHHPKMTTLLGRPTAANTGDRTLLPNGEGFTFRLDGE